MDKSSRTCRLSLTGSKKSSEASLEEERADAAKQHERPQGLGAKQPEILDLVSRCSVLEICLRETEVKAVRLREAALSAFPPPPIILHELRSKLEFKEEECASLASERERLHEERAKLEAELQSLQEHGRKVIVEIADSEAAARKMEADLKGQNADMRSELNTAAGKRLKATEAELETVRSERAALEKEAQDLKEGLARLYETDSERLKELAEEVAIAQERAEKAERQVKAADAWIGELEQQAATVEERAEKAERQVKEADSRICELEQQAAIVDAADGRDAAAQELAREAEELRGRLGKFEEIAKGFAGGVEQIVWDKERAEMLTDELENSVSTIASQELQIRALELRLEELGHPDGNAAVNQGPAPEGGDCRKDNPGAADAKAKHENDELKEQIKNISAQRAELARTASVFAQQAEELSKEVRQRSKKYEQALNQLGVMDDVIERLIQRAEFAQDILHQALNVTLNISIIC